MKRALLPLIVLLATAPAASAKQWCVPPASGCTDGNVGTLQGALDLASNTPGPDQIRLGGATYTSSSGFKYDDNGTSTNSVAIRGLSSRSTTLTRSSSGSILSIKGFGGAHNSVTNLRFHITTSTSQGLWGGIADVQGVAVAGDATITSGTGLIVVDGSVRSVRVAMPLSGNNVGVSDGFGDVANSTITADTGVIVGGPVHHCEITGGQMGIYMASGTVDDDIVHIGGSAAERVGLDAENGGFASASAVARHLTIIGDGNPGSIGIRLRATAQGSFDESQTLDVRNTIIRAVAHGYQRIGTPGFDTGTANLTMQYTDYDPATRDDSGPGSGPSPSDPTNPNTDPVFLDAAHDNFRLAFNSPMIDKGDPAALAADEPTTDFTGGQRVVNGRTDIGALEYQRRPPTITSATAAPTAAQVGTPFAFSAAATDPDADPITYAWSFDDGATAAGASVQHAFANPGIHVATVNVTDAAGVSATKTVAVAATAGPVPAVSALKLTPSKFKAKKGTNVSFTLNVAAPVKFSVDRSAAGRKVNGKCRKPTKKNKHAKRCTRHLALKGSFSRSGVAGSNTFHWNGRVGGKALKPGSYRLIATTGSGPTTKVRRASFKVKR